MLAALPLMLALFAAPVQAQEAITVGAPALAFSLDALSAEIELMRQPSVVRFGAVQVNPLDGLSNALEQSHLQLGRVCRPLGKRSFGVFSGNSASGDRGHVFRAGTKLIFLHPAMKEFFNARTPVFVQDTNPFRAVKAVRCKGQQIDAKLLYINW